MKMEAIGRAKVDCKKICAISRCSKNASLVVIPISKVEQVSFEYEILSDSWSNIDDIFSMKRYRWSTDRV
jgi:hypothetical protein